MRTVLPQEYFSPEDPIRSDVPPAYTPTVSLRLISDAGRSLVVNPGTELEVHPQYRHYITEQAGGTALESVLAQSAQGPSNPEAPCFEAMVGEVESCYLAEPRILQALALRHPDQSDQSIRIVFDGTGKPLIVQKNVDGRIFGARIALSLNDLTIGQVTWPEGTLLQVRSPHRVERGEPVAAIGESQIAALGVLRLSAFALPPSERSAFRANAPRYSPVAQDVVAAITMDEIRERVLALMPQRIA